MKRLILLGILSTAALAPVVTNAHTQRAGAIDPAPVKRLAPSDDGFVAQLAGSWEGRGIVAYSRTNFASGRCRIQFTSYGTGTFSIDPLPVTGPGSTITATQQFSFDYLVVGDAILISRQMAQPFIGSTGALLAVRVSPDTLEFVSSNGSDMSAIGGGAPVGYSLTRK